MRFIQTPKEIVAGHKEFIKSLELKGYKLRLDPNGDLTDYNARRLMGFLLTNHTSYDGVTDLSFATRWAWLRKDQYNVEWEIPPAGVAAKQERSVKKPEGRMPVFGSTTALSELQAKESKERAEAIWARCISETRKPQGNTRGRTLVRQQEITNIINGYRGRTDEASARECWGKVESLKKSWRD